MAKTLLPGWAYNLDFNLGWWRALDGSLIDPDGNIIVGANENGTYISVRHGLRKP